MSIRTKLFAAFGAVLLLLAVVAAVGLRGASAIDAKADRLAETDLPAVDLIAHLQSDLQAFRRYETALAATSDPELARSYVTKLQRRRAAIGQRLAEYRPLVTDAEDRGDYAKVTASWRAYQRITARIPALARAGQPDAIAALVFDEKAKDTFDANDAVMVEWSGDHSEQAEASGEEAEEAAASASRLIVVVSLLALLIGLGVAAALARSIVGRTARIAAAAKGIAEGDVDQDVADASRDELGRTARSFGSMVSYLKEMAGAAGQIAEGDLTVQVQPRSDRDVLGTALAQMTGNLRGMIGGISEAAGTMSSASQQMAATSEEAGRAVGEIAHAVGDVAAGAERQVQAVEVVRRATDELSQTTSRSADSAHETAAAARQAREVARHGADAVSQASSAMAGVRDATVQASDAIGQLGAKSAQIGGIVATITAIAEQTNLLALNAAIEAARAGDQGRGFAVVADEVRKLAEESQHAAASIAELIREIQTHTDRAVQVVDLGATRSDETAETVSRAQTAFADIARHVDDVTDRVTQIAEAVAQASAGSAQMTQEITGVAAIAEQTSASTEEVSASTEQTSASAEQIAASAQTLAATAADLEALVGRFRVA